MIRTFSFVAALVLASCTASVTDRAVTRSDTFEPPMPSMKHFGPTNVTPPTQSNADIARDFLDLHFRLESGRSLERYTRFERPIQVRVTGNPTPSLMVDLKALIRRLRAEAGLDITLVTGREAEITIQAVSRGDIRRSLPQAACFVVPNVNSLADFRRNRRSAKTNWALIETREKMGIFLPYDASPQEVRDCLHEELAQALGPLNDLYRLSDSVFNDDNVHTILTGYDMLILRASYAPELQSGMTKAEVAARLPDVLRRLNPRGRGGGPTPVDDTPRSWIGNVQTALGPGADLSARRTAAAQAEQTARSLGWQDHRRAFGHYMLGRMTQVHDPTGAQVHYASALEYLSGAPGTYLHRAYITTQTAAYAISRGDGAAALRQINPQISIATRAQNAALLATLMLLKAEALDLLDRPDEASSVRLDSLGWARYGFGPEWAVRAKMREIATISPRARDS
jgi:hypothetical protein